jgi:hypothetical protein
LIARFKEREETVKIDIFSVFVDLLRQTNLAAARASDADAARAPLRATVPALMKGVAGQLKERSLKTKVQKTAFTSSPLHIHLLEVIRWAELCTCLYFVDEAGRNLWGAHRARKRNLVLLSSRGDTTPRASCLG